MRSISYDKPYRKKASNDGYCVASDTHIECLGCRQPSLLKKVRRVSTKWIAIECLDGVNTKDNDSPSKINTLETSSIRCLCIDSPFMLCRNDHESNILFNIEIDICRRCETLYNISCVIQATSSDKPPWRFGREIDERDQKNRPKPPANLSSVLNV